MHGVSTAIITPFKNGKLDAKAFEKIMKVQIASGLSSVTIGGTTGESPTLSHDEIAEMVNITVDVRKSLGMNDFKIIVGAGSNSTEHVVHNMHNLEKIGNVDAALIVMPYYNKPMQEGLLLHFEEITKRSNVPVILYNVPSRTVTDMSATTVAKLANNPKIIGIKDASDDIARMYEHKKLISNSSFAFLSGDDFTFPAFHSVGGCGLISVASNIIPNEMAKIHTLCDQKKYDEANTLNAKNFDLYKLMFAETNPTPVKYAMHLMGFCDAEYRLPLCSPTEKTRDAIKKLLQDAKII